ncbi:uncharacterized protein LOC142355224 [Convolutriloba macropyga]|uniref:uncharacterized protein LOC142355224 n=1 Tax=Convolutriloba macropyga TaxID=536237 RepID=UPI003F526730
MDDEPVNDLALIKTDRIIERSQFYSLPICTMATLREQLFQTIIAACGMGSVFGNKSKPIFPETLQETLFHQTHFEGVTPYSLVECPMDRICTHPVIDGGSICAMDEGSPLYKLHCITGETECVYGIASFYRNIQDEDQTAVCNGGSYFASVVYLQEWITTTLIRNINNEN